MKIVIAHPAFRPFEALLRERLGAGHAVNFVSSTECDERGARFDTADVLVSARFPAAWAPSFPALKLLHAAGAGLDKIDMSALSPRVRICCTFGHGPAMAEFVVMVMLSLLRDLVPADRELRRGRWRGPQFDVNRPLPESLAEKTVLILGTGEIGLAVAELCRAFRARCIGFNSAGRALPGSAFEQVQPMASLHDFLPVADFLVIALPLTDRTRDLVGSRELALLGPRAYVVNVARGPIVNEEALYQALRARALAGAAIDVWYSYPSAGTDQAEPCRFPLRELDNVVMTPHISGTTRATFRHRAEDVAANVLALAAGRPLRHEVPRAGQPQPP